MTVSSLYFCRRNLLSNKKIAQMASTGVYTIQATKNDNLIGAPIWNHCRAQTLPALAGLNTLLDMSMVRDALLSLLNSPALLGNAPGG